MSQQSDVRVEVKYRNSSTTFLGKPEEVWLLLNDFFAQFLPSFRIAELLALRIDLQTLAKDCEGIIAFASEGPVILIPRDKLTDNETILSQLLAARLGKTFGTLVSDSMSKEEIQNKLGKNPKIASTRLGELLKNGFLEKDENECYRLTDFGTSQMQKEVLSKIRSKIL